MRFSSINCKRRVSLKDIILRYERNKLAIAKATLTPYFGINKQLFICLLTFLLTRLFALLLIRLFAYLFIRLFTDSLIHLFAYSLILLFTFSLFAYSLIYLFAYSHIILFAFLLISRRVIPIY